MLALKPIVTAFAALLCALAAPVLAQEPAANPRIALVVGEQTYRDQALPTTAKWRNFLRRFDTAGRRKGEDVAASDSTIIDIQPCGDGFAFAATDPTFGLLPEQGVAKKLQGPRTANMSAKLGSAFALSPDAASVRFGLGFGEEKPVLFDLAAASLTDSPRLPPEFLSAKVDGLPVTDWRNNASPKFKGAKLALEEHDITRSLAIRPDVSSFAIGTSWSVRAYEATGKERWKDPVPGEAWGVDFSATAKSSPSPMTTARSAGCAGATARSCSRSS